MKLSDLDFEHDVFRFLAYDRNGATTRRMDWLLRNRQGLRMRYHLHEVLDIGMYAVKPISWVVHEIEKPGTWHTTVGHGNSMSAKRFLFDLELLYRDVEVYGHDPHTHYYLGVTHHAYVEKMLAGGGAVTPELSDHLDRSIKNLELRVMSDYSDDFVEERWAAMMILGSIFMNLKVHFLIVTSCLYSMAYTHLCFPGQYSPLISLPDVNFSILFTLFFFSAILFSDSYFSVV
jgi:hypothetical protein